MLSEPELVIAEFELVSIFILCISLRLGVELQFLAVSWRLKTNILITEEDINTNKVSRYLRSMTYDEI